MVGGEEGTGMGASVGWAALGAGEAVWEGEGAGGWVAVEAGRAAKGAAGAATAGGNPGRSGTHLDPRTRCPCGV